MLPARLFGILVAAMLTPMAVAKDAVITITPLGAVQKDAVGILPPEVSGIPSTFWGQSPGSSLKTLIQKDYGERLPAVQDMLMRIMLAQIAPPLGQGAEADLLLARLDYLIGLGALDPADALASSVTIDEPELFARWFDINILQRRPDRACAPLLERSSLATDLPRRIFCLAQNSDWSAAEVALSLGTTLGEVTPQMGDLLGHYLDREMFEDVSVRLNGAISPIEFVLAEQLDAPYSENLPLAYLSFTPPDALGWKENLYRAESLSRARGNTPAHLIATYSTERPSASGGIWDRVAAVQRLMDRLKNGDVLEISEALIEAFDQMRPSGLLHPLAEHLGPRLDDLALTERASEIRMHLRFLRDDGMAAAALTVGELPPEDMRRAVITDDFSFVANDDPLKTAISISFTEELSSGQYRQMFDAGQTGLAVLTALHALKEGEISDPREIPAALQTLRAAGFDEEARHIALQILIFDLEGRQ